MTITIPTGATVFTLAGAFGGLTTVSPMLKGTVAAGNTVVPIPYNNWGFGTSAQLQQGASLLDTQLTSVAGQKIVFAHSLGSVCASYWLAQYGPTSTVSHSTLFILLGNSNRPYGGLCKAESWFTGADIPTSTPYTVYDYARQYDGWADWPSSTGSGAIAWYNALSGQGNIHPYYNNVTLNDASNVTYSVGNIHYMWGQTYPVAFATNPYQVFLSTNLDVYRLTDEAYRPSIEAAYSRPVTIPTPTY